MRQRKRVGALSVLALIASLFATLVSAPAASAATVSYPGVNCNSTYQTTTFNDYPVDITTTVTDLSNNPIASVQEGDQFQVTVQGSVTIGNFFTSQAAPAMDSVTFQRVHISLPAPAGATGPALTLEWVPGPVAVSTAPGSGIGVPQIVMTSPAQTVGPFTANTGASVADFALDPALPGSAAAVTSGGTNFPVSATGTAAATEMDMFMPAFGLQVGFNCTNPTGNYLSLPITPAPLPTLAVSSVSGQAVTNAARPGNVIDFGGPNWAPSSNISVEMCDLLETTCSAADLTAVSASITAGTLSGQATVATGATTGARVLRVSTDQSETDSTQMLILGTPTISAPLNGGLGAPLTITGTNWNPSSLSTMVMLVDGTQVPVAAAIPATVSSTGSFTVNTTVAAGMAFIAAVDVDPSYPAAPAPGSLFAASPFTVSANSCTANPSCSIDQTVLFTTDPGTLAMSQDTGIVDLGNLQLDGRAHHIPGAINQITVVDATGSLNGWDLTATMTDLITNGGGGNKTIPAGNMQWAPACTPIDADLDGNLDGSAAEIVSGGSSALDPVTARTLCDAAPGGGGGTFTGNAALDLFVPANVAAGDYQAKITFLLM